MAWGRRRSRNTSSKPSGYEGRKNASLMRIREFLYGRLNMYTPCPFTPDEIYHALFTTDQQKAIAELSYSMPSILVRQKCVRIPTLITENTEDPYGKKTQIKAHLVVSFEDDHFIPETQDYSWSAPNGNVKLDFLSKDMQEALIEWTPKYAAGVRELEGIIKKAEELFNVCNTVGQVVRLWPTLIPFLYSGSKDRVLAAKAKSKLPDCVFEDKEAGKLYEAYRPEAFAPYDGALAEALLCPEELRDVPPVYVEWTQ